MDPKEAENIKQELDTSFALTLKFMDEEPVMQTTAKMSPEELEALSETERAELRARVLAAIQNAKEKAAKVMVEKNRIYYCPQCAYVWRDSKNDHHEPLYVKPCPRCGNHEYTSHMTHDITDSTEPFYERIKNEFLSKENRECLKSEKR